MLSNLDYTLGLGLVSAFLFVILLLTGITLMLYYNPISGESLRFREGYYFYRSRRKDHPEYPPLGCARACIGQFPAYAESFLYRILLWPNHKLDHRCLYAGYGDTHEFQWLFIALGSTGILGSDDRFKYCRITKGADRPSWNNDICWIPADSLRNCLLGMSGRAGSSFAVLYPSCYSSADDFAGSYCCSYLEDQKRGRTQ